ncbi:terminase TerL endonuclease subunit [uncultured Sphingomonas sp.]|uniref:terminase TerL endonuclease subunit n=1 Tax=uncultured Sphingomonas sp. TaxID=158754 RepID=UPI0035CB15F6
MAREEHEHAIKVAAENVDAKDDDATYLGGPIDDRTFSYVCGLDRGDDPLADPSCWAKANPLLGVTITEEYLADVVKQAIQMPGKRNGILRLHFCVWTDSEVLWITRDVVEPALVEFDPVIHHGKRIGLGLDLSRNKDITALGAAVQTGTVAEGEHKGKPTYDAWIEDWTPGDTLRVRADADKQPYDVCVLGRRRLHARAERIEHPLSAGRPGARGI